MKKIIILIISVLLLTSCNESMGDIKRGSISTNIKNACETIGGKYSEDTRCCYEKNLSDNMIIKECDEKRLQEKSFIYSNF